MIRMRSFNKFEENNLKFLTQKNIEYTLVQITETGYKKSILDATDPMRQYFKTVGMHDYSLYNHKGKRIRFSRLQLYWTKHPCIQHQHLCIVRRQRKATHVFGQTI